jgi:hypothetical protein
MRGTVTNLIFKLDTHVSALLEELDKIDPVWYNANMNSPYRNFGGSIYSTEGMNITDHEILMELLRHVHTVYKDTLPSCYVNHIPNPDVYYDAIEFIEDIIPELKEEPSES